MNLIKMLKQLPLYITSFFAGPILIIIMISLILLTNENFYIKTIKALEPIKTFINARNSKFEKSIRTEIEEKTGLASARISAENIKKKHELLLKKYNILNKTTEHKKLQQNIKELKDLEWAENSGMFKSGKDFERFRKNKLEELSKEVDQISEFRNKNEDQIEKSEDILEDIDDKYEDAMDDLKDKEEEAEEIASSRRSEIMNSMFNDISKVEKDLTNAFNDLFLEQEIKRIIKKQINFITTYDLQLKNGNIYTNRLDVSSGMIKNRKVIVFPETTINLMVKTEKNKPRKHLLADVFAGIIDKTKDLKSPWVLKKIFTLSNSWIGETLGNGIMKKTGLKINNGRVHLKRIKIKGKIAKDAGLAIKILSIGNKYIYAFPVIIALFYILIIITSGGIRKGVNKLAGIMKYSFMLFFLISFAIVLASFIPGLLINIPLKDRMEALIAEKVISTVLLYSAIPVTAAMFTLSIAGSLLSRLTKSKRSVD